MKYKYGAIILVLLIVIGYLIYNQVKTSIILEDMKSVALNQEACKTQADYFYKKKLKMVPEEFNVTTTVHWNTTKQVCFMEIISNEGYTKGGGHLTLVKYIYNVTEGKLYGSFSMIEQNGQERLWECLVGQDMMYRPGNVPYFELRDCSGMYPGNEIGGFNEFEKKVMGF